MFFFCRAAIRLSISPSSMAICAGLSILCSARKSLKRRLERLRDLYILLDSRRDNMNSVMTVFAASFRFSSLCRFPYSYGALSLPGKPKISIKDILFFKKVRFWPRFHMGKLPLTLFFIIAYINKQKHTFQQAKSYTNLELLYA